MSLFPSLRLSEGQQLLLHKLVHYSSVQCLIKHIVDSNFKKIISIYVKKIYIEKPLKVFRLGISTCYNDMISNGSLNQTSNYYYFLNYLVNTYFCKRHHLKAKINDSE